jgi:membrane protein implicated in regulation of membrane protease activity
VKRLRRRIRFFVIIIVAVVLALAGAAVYVRRKHRADGSAPVQLGGREGAVQDVFASDPGVAAVQAAAAGVRAAFRGI